MTIFDGPVPHDHVYMKLAGCKEVVSCPFCEAFTVVNDVVFDSKNSDNTTIVIKGKQDNKLYKFTKADLIKRLQADIYGDTDPKFRITDLVIQPEGEMQTPEVTAFIEKY